MRYLWRSGTWKTDHEADFHSKPVGHQPSGILKSVQGTDMAERLTQPVAWRSMPGKVISGGPMMGICHVWSSCTMWRPLLPFCDPTSDAKGKGAIPLTADAVSVCPGRIPAGALRPCTARRYGSFRVWWNGMLWMGCWGICPAKRPLTDPGIGRSYVKWFWQAGKRNKGEEIVVEQMFNVSSNPHVRARMTTTKNHGAGCRRTFADSDSGVYNFGFRALAVLIIYRSRCTGRWLYDHSCISQTQYWISAVLVVGLLLTVFPLLIPAWRICNHHRKAAFGGLGQNFMNRHWLPLFPYDFFCRKDDRFFCIRQL